MKPKTERLVTFTHQGEPCARLYVTEDGAFSFLEEESYDSVYGWLHACTTRCNTLDEVDREFDDRCDWYDSTGCFPVDNPAFV